MNADTINKSSLLQALTEMLNTQINEATCTVETLQGGTVGEVNKLSGKAMTDKGEFPYILVLKTQKQWERYGDPDCWRREHDIYQSELTGHFPLQLLLPPSYLLEETENETKIWMEYVDGATGSKQLNADELSYTAEKIGQFQAGFYLNGQRNISCLRPFPAVESSYSLWYGRVKDELNAPIYGFPDELRLILVDYATRADEVLFSFKKLPLTLCQGDIHHDNIIIKESDVYIIDWDCAGYGYMGEDAVDVLLEAFVYSDRSVEELPYYRKNIFEAYCAGAKSSGVEVEMDNKLIRDLFALAWGFRIVDHYCHHYKDDKNAQDRFVQILSAMLVD